MLNLRAPNSFLSRRRVLVYYSVLHSLLYVVHTQGAPGYPPEYDPKPPGMIPGCGLTKHTKHTQPSGCFLARPQSSRIAQRGPRVLCIYLVNQAQLKTFLGIPLLLVGMHLYIVIRNILKYSTSRVSFIYAGDVSKRRSAGLHYEYTLGTLSCVSTQMDCTYQVPIQIYS